jgi:transposase
LTRPPQMRVLLADRGCDADWIRTLATAKGVWANIPPRCNRNDPVCFGPYLCRARNLVQWFFNKIKQCRRAASRYDKLAANFLAFAQLASIRLWLRVNESTPKPGPSHVRASGSNVHNWSIVWISLTGYLLSRCMAAPESICSIVKAAAFCMLSGKLERI